MGFSTHKERLALAENAIHKALAHIQDEFLTDGGFADLYFDGGELPEFKQMRDTLVEYIEAEKNLLGFFENPEQ